MITRWIEDAAGAAEDELMDEFFDENIDKNKSGSPDNEHFEADTEKKKYCQRQNWEAAEEFSSVAD